MRRGGPGPDVGVHDASDMVSTFLHYDESSCMTIHTENRTLYLQHDDSSFLDEFVLAIQLLADISRRGGKPRSISREDFYFWLCETSSNYNQGKSMHTFNSGKSLSSYSSTGKMSSYGSGNILNSVQEED